MPDALLKHKKGCSGPTKQQSRSAMGVYDDHSSHKFSSPSHSQKSLHNAANQVLKGGSHENLPRIGAHKKIVYEEPIGLKNERYHKQEAQSPSAASL